MILIDTYIQKSKGKYASETDKLVDSGYFNILDFDELEKNKQIFEEGNLIYVSGYIEIKYFGKSFLGRKYWDYVFWLWTEIIANMENVIVQNENVDILFPDQALYLFMRRVDGGLLVGIKTDDSIQDQVFLPETDFFIELIKSGLNVFRIINRFGQSGNSTLMINRCEYLLHYLKEK